MMHCLTQKHRLLKYDKHFYPRAQMKKSELYEINSEEEIFKEKN